MMTTGWVCIHTQSSIDGSSMHIRGQERPDSINKEAKQITLATSQRVCMNMSTYTTRKYTKRGGLITGICVVSLIETHRGQSKNSSCSQLHSASQRCYFLQNDRCSAVCESENKVGVESKTYGLVLHLSHNPSITRVRVTILGCSLKQNESFVCTWVDDVLTHTFSGCPACPWVKH